MAYYNASELKSKLSGGKTRELNMGKNEQKMIWIPRDQFFFLKKHYEIQKVPGVTTNRKSCWCLNLDYGKDNKECKICNYVSELWGKWRGTSNKDEKLKIQGLINRLNSEYFYVNGVDMADPDLKFVAVRFTPSKIRDIMNVIEHTSIERIKWLYKKSVTPMANGKERVAYTLTELIDDKDAIELSHQYDELAGRPYDSGGLIDLDSAYGKKQTAEELENYLTTRTEEASDDDTLDSYNDDDVPTNKTKSNAPNTTVNKTETKSISDLDDVSLDDADLSLDDGLSLDDLSLDDKDKMVIITPDFINTNKNNKSIINPIIEHFNNKKYIVATDNYAQDIKLVYAYLKANKVEVPESLVSDVVTF